MNLSEFEIKADNEPRDMRCDACGAVIYSVAQKAILVPQFILRVQGLERVLQPPTPMPPHGNIVTITEHPTICAKVECLTKVLGDPSWPKKTVEDWRDERAAREKQHAEDQARFDAFVVEDQARLEQINALEHEFAAVSTRVDAALDTRDATGALEAMLELRALQARMNALCPVHMESVESEKP